MTFRPASPEELAAALKAAQLAREPFGPVDLSRLNCIRRYAPEDLTITVQAGLTLGALQAELARHGQWLPIDPPGAENVSIAAVLDANLSGPHRQGHGTIREYLIGLRVALPDGRLIHSGGEVVKNVAGFDLLKLFVGARRTLGVIVEAAFKLLPRPAMTSLVASDAPSWTDAERLMNNVQQNAITPVVMDLHNIHIPAGAVARLVLGFSGTPDEVTWQLGEARALGVSEPSSLDYAIDFHRLAPGQIRQRSVLPSRTVETLKDLGRSVPTPFVARAGLGIIEYQGPAPGDSEKIPVPGLVERIKDIFDPARILPELSA